VHSVVTWSMKGTLLSWSPYIVKLFLDVWKDKKYLGIEFHYSWLIMIIVLVGWRHPKFSMSFRRIGKRCILEYVAVWHISTKNERKANLSIFEMFLEEIQEKVEDTSRTPPEVVEEHKKIAYF